MIALSNGSGALTDIDRYDEYGIPGSSNAGRFQYTGQQWLPEVGMYYYRNRVYSPTLGRFMQTDPTGFWGGMNIYAYTQNDPVNFADPSGLGDGPIVNGCQPGFVYDPVSGKCAHEPDTGSGGAALLNGFGASRGTADLGGVTQGSDLVEQLVVVTGTRQRRPGHYYPVTTRICTSASGRTCHLERVNSEACVIPGRISPKPIESGGLYFVYAPFTQDPAGLVRTTQTGPLSFRNTTTWAHPFTGTVDRNFSQDVFGNVDVTTIGQGTALTEAQDWLNQRWGPSIFALQDQLCSALVGGP